MIHIKGICILISFNSSSQPVIDLEIKGRGCLWTWICVVLSLPLRGDDLISCIYIYISYMDMDGLKPAS